MGRQGCDNEVWFQEQEDQRQSPVSEYHDLQPSVSWISGESQGYVMQPAEEGPHSHHPRLVLGNVSGRGF